MNNKLFNLLLTFLAFSYCSLSAKHSYALYDLDYRQQVKEIKKEEKNLEQKKKQVAQTYKENSKLAHQKNQLNKWADKKGFIWFKDKSNPSTYFLSNFYPSSVQVGEVTYQSAEAAFQAHKFTDNPDLFKRFKKSSAEESWELGQKWSHQQRKDWYQVRETIMLAVIRAKFQQNPELTQLLIATGDAYLVEHTKRDAFWADAKDGTGKNRLGHLLMQLRGELGGVGVVSKSARYRQFVQ